MMQREWIKQHKQQSLQRAFQNNDSVQTFALNYFYFCHIGFKCHFMDDYADAANEKVWNNSAMIGCIS